MILSLGRKELQAYVARQLETFFPDGHRLEGGDVDQALDLALERTEHCFRHIALPAYFDEGQARFSHLHSDQYGQFLYFFSNSLWKLSANKPACDRLILLNKALNGMFYSYKCALPSIFLFGHPSGTIIGNAVYSDFLVVFQNVTVNTDADPQGNPAPVLGKGLFLAAGARIIGNRPVGDRVSVGVDAVVYNEAIPDDSVVMRDRHGEIRVERRKKDECMAQRYFNVRIG
jgi:serine O-acetyltransferase